MSHSRNPPPRGQGAARAKQMGLLLDLSPDGGMGGGGNEKELEAELLALMGGSQGKKGQEKVRIILFFTIIIIILTHYLLPILYEITSTDPTTRT
ncbi:unnamed protein product, partial [Oncorhynchus mykiss]